MSSTFLGGRSEENMCNVYENYVIKLEFGAAGEREVIIEDFGREGGFDMD